MSNFDGKGGCYFKDADGNLHPSNEEGLPLDGTPGPEGKRLPSHLVEDEPVHPALTGGAEANAGTPAEVSVDTPPDLPPQ